MARTSTGPGRSRARRGEGDRLREDILAAATRLLEETGDENAVSIRGVAEAVGVTPPSIYLHFDDKTALLLDVCRQQFRAFDDTLAEAEDGLDDPIDSLRAMGRAYVAFGRAHPEMYRILFMHRPGMTHARHDLPEMLAEAGFGRLTDAVGRALEAGRMTGDPALIAVQLWAGVHGITSLLVSHPDFPWPDEETVIEHVLEGLLRSNGA